MSWYVFVNNEVAPGSPYPSKEAAEAALAKRKAADEASGPPINYEYKILAPVK